MQTPETPLFTPTEAGALTGLPVKAVHNAIDKKTVAAVTTAGTGGPTRLLDLPALLSLTLERHLANRLVPEARRELFAAVTRTPRNAVSLDEGFLKVDLKGPRRELAASLRQLRRARQMVTTDPDILGGDPVFKRTRVPVHLIATLLVEGSSKAEILESYPSLTPAMLGAAPIYASAYPLRGRPRSQPWHDDAPRRRSRRPLGTIEAG